MILKELSAIGLPVVLPLHPRTRKTANSGGVSLRFDNVHIIDPIGYVEFLGLLADSALVVADSGGIQEEVSVLKRPMVVVRRSTERPEVIGSFCTLVTAGPEISESAARWMAGEPYSLHELAAFESPYGDGRAAQRSVAAITGLIGERG